MHRPFLVGEENLFHTQGSLFAVEKGVGLEVVLERAEVDVRRTAGADAVVANHQLRMQEPVLIEAYFHAGLHRLAQIAAAGPVNKSRIVLLGH